MKISASKLLSIEPVDILNNFIGEFDLVFENGETIKSTGMEIVISRYAWNLINKFPKLKLIPDYHISRHMKSRASFTSSSFRIMMSKMMCDIFDIYPMKNNEQANKLQSAVWEEYMSINNRLFNDMLIYGGKYHITLTIEDILDIKLNPEILSIDEKYPVNSETAKDPNYIPTIYKKKQNVIASDKLFDNNISIMARCGVIKIPQLMQCLGPRGSVTDINSNIFDEPIPVGYLDGFHRIYDSMIESRTAAMSLNNQSGPLKFTEYFSRRVQFIGMQLSNLHFGDCGTEHHLEFQVRDNRDGYVISDLELLEGIYYLDEENSTKSKRKYKAIKKTDHHLIGKRIKIRTVLGCQHPDPYGVCSTCFGEASRQVPKYRNIGHFAVISFTQIITQLVLSTKHHTGSAVASQITLSEETRKIFEEVNDGLAIGINPSLVKNCNSIKLLISESSVDGLSDIMDVADVGILSPKRTSHINRVRVITEDKSGNIDDNVYDVVPMNDIGYLSIGMLRHMKNNGWIVNKDGFIEIELINYPINNTIMEITPKQYNMFKYAKTLERLIKSSVKEIRKRATAVTPESFLMELSDAVNQKLGINFSILQIIAYTMLATDIERKDYSLPKPHTKHGVGTMDHLLWGRSLSAALAYEKQGYILNSPNSFRYTNRPDSPMDEFFTPEQMDLEYYRL